MTSALPAGTLRWKDIAQLTSSAGYPCVTLLLSTTPGPRMNATDVLALNGLLEQAERALATIADGGGRELLGRLRALADRATGHPVGPGLGLFVNRELQRSIVLPVEVTSRVLIEPSFATRDLLRALYRTPPYLLLTLYPGMAGFFHAQGVTLTPVGQLQLSVGAASRASRDGDSMLSQAAETLLEEVDVSLGHHRALFPSPLVVAGTAALVDAFCRRSRHLTRLAGRITDAETPEALQRAAARALERYLRSRREEALELVEHTRHEKPHLLAAGLQEAWTRAHEGVPVMLAVEHGYFAPGHHFATVSSGDAPDPMWLHDLVDDPYHVHDLVDDLIEAVIKRGGWVAFVDDDALAEHGRVALVSAD